jgi:hypothetical protein
VPVATLLASGRRAALRLARSGSAWTRAAALEALSGDELALRTFLQSGLALATEQDNRALVWVYAHDQKNPALARAAIVALAGSAADVRRFLETQQYEGKQRDDRARIAYLLAAGGPAMQAAARAALDGTAADQHTFLRSGQYVAAERDHRVIAAASLNAGGPEEKSAAQIALAGPRSFARAFVELGAFKARQRDLEAATHAKRARSLVAHAYKHAADAHVHAANAQRVAAEARQASADAAVYAQRARDSAAQAASYAGQAKTHATDARASADAAIQSANVARQAAAAANQRARDASQSVMVARTAVATIDAHARDAFASAAVARSAAVAASRSAEEAEAAAWEAAAIYAERQRQAELQLLTSQSGAMPGANAWCAERGYPAPCVAPAPVEHPPQEGAHGEFWPAACEGIEPPQIVADDRAPSQHNYYCGIWDWRCGNQWMTPDTRVYAEPEPRLIGYVPYEVPEAPGYYPDNSSAGERFSQTPAGRVATLVDLIGQFQVTTGTGIEVTHYREHRSCQRHDVWGYDGFHEVSYRTSVRQQCFKILIVYGPISVVHEYDRYDC